uniref:snRNA-activating protein complex subunit 3 n=1 Tax=Lepeophtheirus salmonis TaxID=72036 RepID=A0A0K2UFP8_LEPSM
MSHTIFISIQLLVVVRIYRPIKYDTHRHSLLDRTRYTQELYLLGKNKLSELRDHIKCALDHSVSADLSHYPNESKSVKNGKELYKSGFLFINDCFYNDMRWPDCIDYSEVILNWANQPGRKLGKFTKAIMEDTYIRDLDIRLGYPYVYVHHGEHEHLFSFVDARLVSANDPQEVSNYPYERSVGIRNGKNCMICSMFVAKWITTENDRVPEDPFYFCEDCFHNFNYGKDGSKIGNFKAYKYVDNNAL